MYEVYKEQDALCVLLALLLEEAHALQLASKLPHPSIVSYHGCRVRRGRITGLFMDRYQHDLNQYLEDGIGSIDKLPFLTALESGIRHLHSLGLAHNDVNPANIMVSADGMPILVDFGSSREIGQRLTKSRGTQGWVDDDDDYAASEACHNLFALDKIRAWLDKPTFDDR